MWHLKQAMIVNMATSDALGYIAKITPETCLDMIRENGDIVKMRVISSPAYAVNMATGECKKEHDGLFGITFLCHKKMVEMEEYKEK